jgi:hypothetical protein
MPLEAIANFDGHAFRSLPEGVEGHIVSCCCNRLTAENERVVLETLWYE